MADEFQFSELDSEVYKFLEENKNLELKITIEFVEDLGLRVECVSEGSIGRSGDSVSATTALLRLIPKVRKSIKEYDDAKEQLASLFTDDDEDE